ncbi:Peroxisomal membrane protein 11A, partial [Galemys pyrenaicus]
CLTERLQGLEAKPAHAHAARGPLGPAGKAKLARARNRLQEGSGGSAPQTRLWGALGRETPAGLPRAGICGGTGAGGRPRSGRRTPTVPAGRGAPGTRGEPRPGERESGFKRSPGPTAWRRPGNRHFRPRPEVREGVPGRRVAGDPELCARAGTGRPRTARPGAHAHLGGAMDAFIGFTNQSQGRDRLFRWVGRSRERGAQVSGAAGGAGGRRRGRPRLPGSPRATLLALNSALPGARSPQAYAPHPTPPSSQPPAPHPPAHSPELAGEPGGGTRGWQGRQWQVCPGAALRLLDSLLRNPEANHLPSGGPESLSPHSWLRRPPLQPQTDQLLMSWHSATALCAGLTGQGRDPGAQSPRVGGSEDGGGGDIITGRSSHELGSPKRWFVISDFSSPPLGTCHRLGRRALCLLRSAARKASGAAGQRGRAPVGTSLQPQEGSGSRAARASVGAPAAGVLGVVAQEPFGSEESFQPEKTEDTGCVADREDSCRPSMSRLVPAGPGSSCPRPVASPAPAVPFAHGVAVAESGLEGASRKAIQYTCMLLRYLLEPRAGKEAVVTKLKNLESSVSTGRKCKYLSGGTAARLRAHSPAASVLPGQWHLGLHRHQLLAGFRLGNVVHAVQAARQSLHAPELVPRLCLTLANVNRVGYFVCDTILWAGSVGLAPGVERDKWRLRAARYYCLSLLLSLARDLYEILLQVERVARDRARKGAWASREPPACSVADEETEWLQSLLLLLCRALRRHPPLLLDTVRNCCDLLIPLDQLGIYKCNPGVLGLGGLVSSVAGIVAVAYPHLKLKTR